MYVELGPIIPDSQERISVHCSVCYSRRRPSGDGAFGLRKGIEFVIPV